MNRLTYLLLSFSALLSVCQAASTDPVCVQACSDWSIVLGHCRAVYGNEPWQHNSTFANEFVACCCAGEENDKVLGQEAALRSAGLCQSCVSTPPVVRDDLSQLLELCAIQAENGTAADAESFKPQGYATSNVQDRTKAGTSLDKVSAGERVLGLSLGGLGGAVTGVLMWGML